MSSKGDDVDSGMKLESGQSELMVSSNSVVSGLSESGDSTPSETNDLMSSHSMDSKSSHSMDSTSPISTSPTPLQQDETLPTPLLHPTDATREENPTPVPLHTLSPEEEPQVFFIPTHRPRRDPNAVTFIQRNANGDTWTSHSLPRATSKPTVEKQASPPSLLSPNSSDVHPRPHRLVTVLRSRNRSSLMTYIRRSDGTMRLRTERDLLRIRRKSADLDAELLEEDVPDGGELTHAEPDSYHIDLLRNCHLLVSNVTQRGLSDLQRSSYLFPSEEACRERNRRVDKEFLENDIRNRNETEWTAMRLETLADTSLHLPEDHLSITHVRHNYQTIRRRELRVVNTLMQRMNESKCFTQPIQKYLMMSEELGTAQENSWELLRFRLHSRGGDSVTRDDLMSTYRNMITSRRGNRQELYHNVFHYSENSQPCDGCVISRRKTFKPQTVYPRHLLIRKFVGDTEVNDISTSENRSVACV